MIARSSYRQPFMHQNPKRQFNTQSLITGIYNVIRYLPWTVWAYVFRGFTAAFSERILLVISGVNNCAYCSWFHSHVALRNGVSPIEVEQLLKQLLPQGMDEKEITALLFAMHFAQSGGQPHVEEISWLKEDYTENRAKGIQGLCAAIYFGNLCGNTFDAFINRLQGNPWKGSSLFIELPVFIVCAPFLLPLVSRIRNA